jgi:hypothetical protein
MGKKNRTELAIAGPAPVALQGEVVDAEGEVFEPIPYNDQKAIADEVNRLTQVVDELEGREGVISPPDHIADVAACNARIDELETKLERLLSTWEDPDATVGEGDSK